MSHHTPVVPHTANIFRGYGTRLKKYWKCNAATNYRGDGAEYGGISSLVAALIAYRSECLPCVVAAREDSTLGAKTAE